MTNQKKLETLKTNLLEMGHANPEELKNLTVENCFDDSYNTFEIIGNEYKVLTDEEVREILKEKGYEPMPRKGGDINLSEYGF